jgi:TolB-like protein
MRIRSLLLAVAMALAASACGGTTRFVNPGFNFSFVHRLAVLPFENLSTDQQVGARATRLFVTEMLASGAVDVVEPGEVKAALGRLAGSSATPTTEQITALGKALNVQALILGNVNESTETRSGTVSVPVITLDIHMVEAETGTTVWAETRTEKGGGFGARFLGTSGEPMSETTRRCVRRLVHDLIR